MKYAICSDIHGNQEALKKVLHEIDAIKDVELYICLGDIVGYGADPESCIDISRERFDLIIAGNHDYAVAGKTDITYFNSAAKEAVLWTRNKISSQSLEFLSGLPLVESVDGFQIAHGTLHNPGQWNYMLSGREASMDFREMKEKLLFVGHSHVPAVFIERGSEILISQESNIEIEREYRYIVNPGSTGQPRDGDPRASFVIYDSENEMVKYFRVEYDIEKAQKKIRNAGLPEILASRLSMGK